MKLLLNLNELRSKLGMPDLPCNISNVFKVEYKLFKDCLGADFYKMLKEKCIDLSDVDPWEAGQEYEQGSIVCFEGIAYEAIKTNSERPINTQCWKTLDKFEDDCFNDIWCMFLCELISWCVLRDRAPVSRMKISNAGFTLIEKDNEKSLSSKDLAIFLKYIDNQITVCLEALHDYMVENKECGCYDLYKGIGESCCKECGYKKCKCTPVCITKRKHNHAWRLR